MLSSSLGDCLSRLGGLFPSYGDSFVPIRPEQLVALEHRFGRPLPEGYRAFILVYGNSRFDHLVGQRFQTGRTVFVSSFYGGDGDGDDSCKLTWAMQVYEGRMPSTILPIAECAEQGEICLVISGPDSGKVFFWDRSNEWSVLEEEHLSDPSIAPETRFQHMVMLANSFEDFVCGLEIIDE